MMRFEWNFASVVRVCGVHYTEFEKGKGGMVNQIHELFVLNGDVGERILHFEDGTTIHSGPREFRYVPIGAKYWVERVKPGHCWMITFHLAENLGETPFSRPVKNYNAMKSVFSEAAKFLGDLHNDTRQAHLLVRKFLYEIIIQLLREQEQQYVPNAKIRLLRPALDEMCRHIGDSDRLTGKELAKLCGISETYFRRLFVECYSTTPKQYILRMRMERAKLFLEGDAPIREIACLCGYPEPSCFTREFTKCVGISPRDYRRSIKWT